MKLFKTVYFKVGLSVFLLYLCIHLWPSIENLVSAIIGAAAPLFIGCAIAYIVNIPMSFLENLYFPHSEKSIVNKTRTPVCLILSFLIIFAIFTFVVLMVFPQLFSCIKTVYSKLPDAIKDLLAWVKSLEIIPESMMPDFNEVDWMTKIGEFAKIIFVGVGNVAVFVKDVLFSVFSLLVSAILATIFAVYLLLGKRKLKTSSGYLMKKFIKKPYYEKAKHIIGIANNSFRQYIVGQCTEAVILGLLVAFGMLLLRLPYIAMISSLIAFTALIPIAGAFIGGGVGTIMIFTVSPVKALIFLIFLLILQQLENNIIFPKVVGTSLGMPSLWVLAAVTVGGGLAGVVGMILSVPIGATIYKLAGEYIDRCRKKDEEQASICSAPQNEESTFSQDVEESVLNATASEELKDNSDITT